MAKAVVVLLVGAGVVGDDFVEVEVDRVVAAVPEAGFVEAEMNRVAVVVLEARPVRTEVVEAERSVERSVADSSAVGVAGSLVEVVRSSVEADCSLAVEAESNRSGILGDVVAELVA